MGIFSEIAAQDPNAIALEFLGEPNETVSFGSLRERSLKHGALSQPGLNLIIMKSSPNAMAAFLGCIAAGNVPAMLSHPDGREGPTDYKAKIAKICDIVKPSFIFTDETKIGTEEVVTNESSGVAFVQFSSGTTGLQKPISITHEAIKAHNEAYGPVIGPAKVFSWLPLYHDMGLIACFLMPLMTGRSIVFMSPFDWLQNPKSMLEAIEKHQCTHCWMPNFAFKFMADRIKDGQWDLSSLRQLINCSEPCYEQSMKAFKERFKLPDGIITTCYAMAENVFAMAQGYPDPELIPSVEAKTVDGEIWIKSPFSITPNEFYATGDLGEVNGSKLKINGRKKDLIITEGRNVYPNDIEQLVGEVQGVYPGRYVALGEFNEKRATEDILILCERKDGDQEVIKRFIRAKVAKELHLTVGDLLILPHGWLRKTSSGKIARSANLDKLREHRKRIEIGIDVIKNIMKEVGKDLPIDADLDLIASGTLSSLEMFTVVLELEVALKTGLGGAYSIYGDSISSLRELVFFAEKKIYGEI